VAKGKGKGRRKNTPAKPELTEEECRAAASLFMDSLTEMAEEDPHEAARMLLDLACDAASPDEAVECVCDALRLAPDCMDIYDFLCDLTAPTPRERAEVYGTALQATEWLLGPRVFLEGAGRFWALEETRPYMLARERVARNLRAAGEIEEACEHYAGMLKLNPKDNQGVRYELMPCLIEMGRDEEAYELLGEYEEDGSAWWAYGRALLDFRKHGDSPQSQESLKKALKTNKNAPAYLTGRKKLPSQSPLEYGFGDMNEAILCAADSRPAWQATPGALEWLEGRVRG
jgi:tetratricopeptide (TPR) repeat protein